MMKHSILCLLLAAGCGDTPAPVPTEANDTTDGEAESCLRTKVWELNRDGWSIRNSGTVRLAGGTHKSYAVNLYTSREYYLLACGAGSASALTLQLYNDKGERKGSVGDQGASTGVYLHARQCRRVFRRRRQPIQFRRYGVDKLDGLIPLMCP